MPNDASTEERIVLDESSFDFRGMADEVIEAYLDDLGDALQKLRKICKISRLSFWDAVMCLDDCELHEFLSGAHESRVDRDTLRRLYTAVDRCNEWDDEPSVSAELDVVIDGVGPLTAPSVGYALAAVLAKRGIACLVFKGCGRRGQVVVDGVNGRGEVFFLTGASQLSQFWRTLYMLEDVAEGDFYDYASVAFPDVVFCDSLSFNRFDGAYRDIRDRLVTVLAGINDYFVQAYREGQGVPERLQALLTAHHVVPSPESPKTHRNGAAMRLRDVVHDGRTYRCEWHAKLEPHRNRVHFSAPCDDLGGRVLVGIFVSHLTT